MQDAIRGPYEEYVAAAGKWVIQQSHLEAHKSAKNDSISFLQVGHFEYEVRRAVQEGCALLWDMQEV